MIPIVGNTKRRQGRGGVESIIHKFQHFKCQNNENNIYVQCFYIRRDGTNFCLPTTIGRDTTTRFTTSHWKEATTT